MRRISFAPVVSTTSQRLLVGLATVSLFMAGCATTSPQHHQDENTLDSIRQAAQRARANPTNAKAARNYSRAVAQGWDQGVFQRCNTPSSAGNSGTASGETDTDAADGAQCEARPNEWTREALKFLKKSAEVHRSDAPIMYAERGFLRMMSGDLDAAIGEYHHSMSLRPNYSAATALIGLNSNDNNYTRIKEICSQTLPHLQGRDRRFKFMQICVKHSGAATDRGALSWTTDKQRTFFRNEKRRRQQAKQRRQRQQQQQQNQQRRCQANCKERGHLCLRDCHTDRCEAECNEAYEACLQKCKY